MGQKVSTGNKSSCYSFSCCRRKARSVNAHLCRLLGFLVSQTANSFGQDSVIDPDAVALLEDLLPQDPSSDQQTADIHFVLKRQVCKLVMHNHCMRGSFSQLEPATVWCRLSCHTLRASPLTSRALKQHLKLTLLNPYRQRSTRHWPAHRSRHCT